MLFKNIEFIKIIIRRPCIRIKFVNDYTISNTLHYRLGNPDLKPEESDNATFGVVITPIDSLTITVDMVLKKIIPLVFLEEITQVFMIFF